MPSEPRAILIIDSADFGTSLALLPAMRAVRSRYENSFIAAASSTGICELIGAESLANDLVDLGLIDSSTHTSTRALKRFIRLIRTAKRMRFDLVLDFSPRSETRIARWLGAWPRTITPSHPLDLLERLAGRLPSGVPSSGSRYKQMLGQLGIRCDFDQPMLRPLREESDKFEKLLERGSRDSAPLLALFSAEARKPGAWPIQRFGETAHRLSSNYGVRVVAIDAPYDKSFTSRVSEILPGGSISLKTPRAAQIVAVLARASLLVTDDPGLARAAASMGTPAIELSNTNGPRDSGIHRIIAGSSANAVDRLCDAAAELLRQSRTATLFSL